MRPVLSLLKANIKHKKGAFKSIAALMAIITLSFSVTLSNNDNLEKALTAAHKAADTGDLVAILADDSVPDNMYEVLDKSEDVYRYRSEECIQEYVPFRIDGKETANQLFILPMSRANPRVIEEGNVNTAPAPLQKGEIYVPYAFSVIGGAKEGSVMEFRSGRGEYDVSFTVKGFTEEPFSSSVVMGIKVVVISDEDYDLIVSEKLSDVNAPVAFFSKAYMVHIFGKGNLSDKELKDRLNKECGISDNAVSVISKKESMSFTNIFSDTGTNLLYVYVALLVIVVLIMMCSSINSSVETEYVNLGILKSQGFTCGQIRLVYILQYTAALVIGSVIGIAASFPIIAVLGRMFSALTGIITETGISVGKCSLICLGILLLCTVFVLGATAKIGKISPVRAISGGKSEIYFDSRLNIKIRKKPLMLFLAIRQLTSRLKDYVGTAMITALLVFFMISIMIFTDGIDTEAIFSIGQCNVTAELSKGIDDKDIADIVSAVKEFDSEAVCYNYRRKYGLMAEGVELACDITDCPDRAAKVHKGRLPIYDNEIAITEIAAEEIGKAIGDTVTVGTGSKECDYLITGYFQSATELGKIFLMTYEGGVRLGFEKPVSMRFIISDENRSEELAELLNDSFGSVLEAKAEEKNTGLENITELVDVLLTTVVAAVFSVSVVFAAVVAGMSSAKAFIRERSDTGIFKAVGFTSGALRIQFSLRFLLMAAVGSILGAVLAMLFAKPMLSALLSFAGLTNFLTEFTPMTFVLPVSMICAGYFVFAYICSRSIRSVEIRELITE